MSILSVDFSKAFNRMDHRLCLDALREKGASTESLAMVKAFLTGRTMRFKVNGCLSERILPTTSSANKKNTVAVVVKPVICRLIDAAKTQINS